MIIDNTILSLIFFLEEEKKKIIKLYHILYLNHEIKSFLIQPNHVINNLNIFVINFNDVSN